MTKGNGLAGVRGKCATCEYSHDLKRPGVKDLQCRRLPPIPMVTGMRIHAVTGAQTADINHVVPMASPDFWCGEYRPRMSDVVPISGKGQWIDIDSVSGEVVPPKEDQ